MKFEFSGQSFEKYSNIQFHENLSSGSRVFPCEQTDATNLIVDFINVPNEVPAGCATGVGHNVTGSSEADVTYPWEV
jgi:hypothetical protein